MESDASCTSDHKFPNIMDVDLFSDPTLASVAADSVTRIHSLLCRKTRRIHDLHRHPLAVLRDGGSHKTPQYITMILLGFEMVIQYGLLLELRYEKRGRYGLSAIKPEQHLHVINTVNCVSPRTELLSEESILVEDVGGDRD